MKIKYKESAELKDKIFNKIIEWCKKEDMFDGEVLCQNDNGLIESPYLVAEIIDMIEFVVDYGDE